MNDSLIFIFNDEFNGFDLLSNQYPDLGYVFLILMLIIKWSVYNTFTAGLVLIK